MARITYCLVAEGDFMYVAILGQAHVLASDDPNAVSPIRRSPIKRRAVAALVAAGPRGLPTAKLTQAVWGDQQDRTPALKTLISELRRVLPGRIPEGISQQYSLRLAPGDTVDVELFRSLVSDGAVAVRGADYALAAELLHKAAHLWGDPPLGDLSEDVDELRQWREALLFEHRAATIALLQVRLELGEDRTLLADLRKALADDPLSERLHGLLMSALQRAGHRAKALEHFEAVRTLLIAETGSGPGSELQRLRDAIDLDALPVSPSQPPSEELMLSSDVPAQLPPAVIDFTGRSQEVNALTEFLASRPGRAGVPIAAIIGPGGIGKSALAVHMAHLIRDHYPDGQIFLELAAMSERPRDIGDVLAELLATLGVAAKDLPVGDGQRAGLVRSYLAGRRMLLLIDDVAAAHQVHQLLPGTTGSAVIVTSRVHLTGDGIRCFRLEPLTGEEGVQLLSEIIGSELVAQEPDAARALVDACGYLPLALRVAGARLLVHRWPISLLAERLTARLGNRLTELSTGELAVSASIAESYDTLPDEPRRAFRVLTLAGPGDWPMWLAAMLLGVNDPAPALEILVMHSLLAPAGVDPMGQPRYRRQHDLMSEYGAQRLDEHVGERDVTIERLLLGWLELTSWAQAAIPDEPYFLPLMQPQQGSFAPAEAITLIHHDPERWYGAVSGNVLAVIQLACEQQRHRLAYGLAVRMSSYLVRQGRHGDAEDMWREVIQAATANNDAHITAEARVRVASLIARQSTGPERALPILDTCVTIFARSVDRRALARALSLRAFCRYKFVHNQQQLTPDLQAHLELARRDAERAMGLAHIVHSLHIELGARRTLALIASLGGRHDEAIGRAEAMLTVGQYLTRDSGDHTYETWALRATVTILLGADHQERALPLSERGAALARQMNHDALQAAFLEQSGDGLAGLGRHAEAVERYRQAAAINAGDHAERRRNRCRSKLLHAGDTAANPAEPSTDPTLQAPLSSPCPPALRGPVPDEADGRRSPHVPTPPHG